MSSVWKLMFYKYYQDFLSLFKWEGNSSSCSSIWGESKCHNHFEGKSFYYNVIGLLLRKGNDDTTSQKALFSSEGRKDRAFQSWRSELKLQYCHPGQITSLSDSQFSRWHNRLLTPTSEAGRSECDVSNLLYYQSHFIYCSSPPPKKKWEEVTC